MLSLDLSRTISFLPFSKPWTASLYRYGFSLGSSYVHLATVELRLCFLSLRGSFIMCFYSYVHAERSNATSFQI